MPVWDVMRQGDNGDEVRMSAHDSRVEALARVLVMESGVAHKQTYWVCGPPGPALRTDRDLYLHFLRLSHEARSGSWTLSGYLRGLWKVSAPLRLRAELELDDVAAMFSAAAATAPPPFDPAWTVADLALPGPAPAGYAHWERVVLSQLADLEDFVRHPPGSYDRFGRNAPRPVGGGTRATPARWLNFDPAAYLERAVAGSHRGSAGAQRTPPTADETTAPPPGVPAVPTLTWADLTRIAVCGQTYE
jgi:hypothetical protein